jgi:hypothetical protein
MNANIIVVDVGNRNLWIATCIYGYQDFFAAEKQMSAIIASVRPQMPFRRTDTSVSFQFCPDKSGCPETRPHNSLRRGVLFVRRSRKPAENDVSGQKIPFMDGQH